MTSTKRSPRQVAIGALAVALAALGVGQVAGAQMRAEPSGERPDCVRAVAVTRMQAYGWNHVVELRNTCSAAVTCRVSSDVRTDPVDARLAAGASNDVLLWLDSPAREFAARVDCQLAR